MFTKINILSQKLSLAAFSSYFLKTDINISKKFEHDKITSGIFAFCKNSKVPFLKKPIYAVSPWKKKQTFYKD